MKKNMNNKNENRNKQNTADAHVNLSGYTGKEKDDAIAKRNAGQYINDVDRSIKQPRNNNTRHNKQQP